MINIENITRDRVSFQSDKRKGEAFSALSMNYFNASKKSHYEEMLKEAEEIAREIEKSSGWRYVDFSFIFLSNYRFNIKNDQIEYDENEVSMIWDGIKPVHDSEREINFIRKYHEELKRIEAISKKKNAYDEMAYVLIEKNKEEKDYLQRVESRKTSRELVEQLEENKRKMEDFYNEGGNEAILLLINYLNRLASKERRETIYEDLLGEPISESIRRELIYWLSIYSTVGESFYKRYLEEHKVTEEKESKKEKNI